MMCGIIPRTNQNEDVTKAKFQMTMKCPNPTKRGNLVLLPLSKMGKGASNVSMRSRNGRACFPLPGGLTSISGALAPK